MFSLLDGSKTYIVGAAMIVYGLYLYSQDQTEQANKLIMECFGLIFLRSGVKKSGPVE